MGGLGSRKTEKNPFTTGFVPQRDLIDKHFHQFLLINQVMSNYQRKSRQVRRVESIWTESNSSLAGKFSHLYQKKGCHDKSFCFHFIQ